MSERHLREALKDLARYRSSILSLTPGWYICDEHGTKRLSLSDALFLLGKPEGLSEESKG